MYDNYLSFIDTSKFSSAKQIAEYSNKRNPIIETGINASKSVELMERMLYESRCSQKTANKQFLITVSIAAVTLLLTGATFLLNFI